MRVAFSWLTCVIFMISVVNGIRSVSFTKRKLLPLGHWLCCIGRNNQVITVWSEVNKAILTAVLHQPTGIMLDSDATEMIANKKDGLSFIPLVVTCIKEKLPFWGELNEDGFQHMDLR